MAWPRQTRLLAALAILISSAATAGDFSVGISAGVDRGKVDCVASFRCDHGCSYAEAYGAY